MVRTSVLTQVNICSWRGASSTTGFSAVVLGNGKEEQGPGRDAGSMSGANLGKKRMKLLSAVAQQHIWQKHRGTLSYREVCMAENIQQPIARVRNS